MRLSQLVLLATSLLTVSAHPKPRERTSAAAVWPSGSPRAPASGMSSGATSVNFGSVDGASLPSGFLSTPTSSFILDYGISASPSASPDPLSDSGEQDECTCDDSPDQGSDPGSSSVSTPDSSTSGSLSTDGGVSTATGTDTSPTSPAGETGSSSSGLSELTPASVADISAGSFPSV